MTDENQKPYRSIREVSEALGVKAHVLRYWETQFPMLRPRKGRSGVRMYRPKDLEMLQQIRQLLYERGFTIAGARRKLVAERHPEEEEEGGATVATPAPLLREIRRELKALQALLAAPPAGAKRARVRHGA